jgi:hypothetical protein
MKTKTVEPHRQSSEPPTLLVFVDAWLKGLKVGDWDGDDRLEKNWTEAQALKEVRKGIWKERAEERRRLSGAAEPDQETQSSSRVTDVSNLPDLDASAAARGGGSADTGSSDAENDIIDHYAALASTVHLPSLLTGSEMTAVNSARSGISGTTHFSSYRSTRLAEEQARSYQALLGTPPPQEESAWEENSVTGVEESHTGGTLWSVICESGSACVVLE